MYVFGKYIFNIPRKFELTSISTFWAKSGQNFSINVKNLNTMIIGVGYNDPVGTAYSYVMRMFQITRFTSHGPKFANKWTVWLEYLKKKVI